MSTLVVATMSHSAARFFRGENDGQVAELATLICPEARMSEQELNSDAPSRTQNSFRTRHAYEPHTSSREKISRKFARKIAEWLDAARVDHLYTRLVLVAPPDMLGAVRKSLSQECRKMVVEECHKNLVHMDVKEMIAAFPHSIQVLVKGNPD